MARSDPSLIGIELHEREIRAVHIRHRGNRHVVVKAGHTSTPEGAISRGKVMEPGIVAVAVRRLLDTMGGTGSSRVVIGISSEQTTFRTFSIPASPESELPALVAGEIDHYSLIRAPGGAYGYFRLIPPTGRTDADPSVVGVVAVEGDITEALRDVASRANLQVEAIEPVAMAMMRTVVHSSPNAATSFALLVGTTHTEAVFFVLGQLVAMRRIDVGSNALIQTLQPASGGPSPFTTELIDGGETRGGDTSVQVNPEGVRRLGLETRHTIDYLQREYPDFAIVDRVYVVASDPGLSSVVPLLAERFATPAELVQPPAGSSDSPEVAMELAGVAGSRYAAAYGLASFNTVVAGTRPPRVDLFSTQRSVAKSETAKRNFGGSIVVSILGLMLGAAGFILYNQQIAKVEEETSLLTSQTAAIKSQTDLTVSERVTRAKQYKALRKEGVPVGVLMDYVVGSIEPGVGLRSVNVSQDLKIKITGEALEETAMIKTTQTLQRSPVVLNLMVNQFSRADANNGNVLTFELEGRTVSADRIKMPNAPGAPK